MSGHGRRDDSTGFDESWNQLLHDLEVRPSKALGQNFLHDRNIVRRIADIAEITPEDDVLEIGPGLGILTAELVNRARSVTAIELDSRLAQRILDRFGSDVRVIEGDVLDVDLDKSLPASPYMVVANLPYSIATAAIQRLFEAERSPARMVVMVQLEVARRMVARPPEMSILAVAVQFYGTAKIMFRIGPGAFIPAPRVDSAVVRIDQHEQISLPRDEHQSFFRLVHAGFAQRRKRLDNSISAFLDVPKANVAEAIAASGLDPSRRAETLTVDEWVTLYRSSRESILA